MRNRALVVGSVAFDVVFSVHNALKDEIVIKDNEVKNISMMLTANNKEVFFGGTAANISYGLGIQGENPMLFSVVGDDFYPTYNDHLVTNGVDIKVKQFPKEFTATFYAISDRLKEQVGIFQPNVHGDHMASTKLTETISKEEFHQIKVALFSPGTGKSISNHMSQLRAECGKDVKIIFDPSQVLSIFFDKKRIDECLELSDIFIGNDTEVKQLQDISGESLEQILEKVEFIIETKGAEGSVIHSKKGKEVIPAFTPKKFVEQTGAGDAFRAGVIKGLLQDLPLKECCELGAILGAKNVEVLGGQNYSL